MQGVNSFQKRKWEQHSQFDDKGVIDLHEDFLLIVDVLLLFQSD